MKKNSKAAQILKLWKQGKSKRAIAFAVGTSRQYVYEVLGRYGFYKSRRG